MFYSTPSMSSQIVSTAENTGTVDDADLLQDTVLVSRELLEDLSEEIQSLRKRLEECERSTIAVQCLG